MLKNKYLKDWLTIVSSHFPHLSLPEEGNVRWYGFRSWIESSYRDRSSDGWQWHKTRLREAQRAERICLAMAVATLWTITMGNEEQEHLPETVNNKGIAQDEVKPKSELKKTNRSISCFKHRTNQYSC